MNLIQTLEASRLPSSPPPARSPSSAPATRCASVSASRKATAPACRRTKASASPVRTSGGLNESFTVRKISYRRGRRARLPAISRR